MLQGQSQSLRRIFELNSPPPPSNLHAFKHEVSSDKNLGMVDFTRELLLWKCLELRELLLDGRNPKQPPGMYQTVNNGIKYLSTGAGFLNHQQYFSQAAYYHRNFPPVLTVSAKDFRSQLDIQTPTAGQFVGIFKIMTHGLSSSMPTGTGRQISRKAKSRTVWPHTSRCQAGSANSSRRFLFCFPFHPFRTCDTVLGAKHWRPSKLNHWCSAVFAKKNFRKHNNSPLGILGTACFTFPYLPYPDFSTPSPTRWSRWSRVGRHAS